MRSRGSISWWCTCPGRQDECTSPTERGHKTYYFAIRLDTTERDQVQVKRGGYETHNAALDDLEKVRALLAVAGDDEPTRRRIADVLIRRSRRGGALPDVDEVRRRFGAGLDPLTPSTTLGEWLQTWLAGKRRAAEGTLELYRQRVAFWTQHLGDVRLDRLRGEHVAGVLDWIDARNAVIGEALEAEKRPPADPLDARRVPVVTSATTQRQVVGVLSMALNAAIKRRLLTHNATHEVELPEADEPFVPRVWDAPQVAAFVLGTAAHRLHALYWLVLLRGLRRGEACGLRWSDVDLDAREMTIRRGMRYAGPARGVGLGRPKTRGSRRAVSLDPDLAGALRGVKTRQRRERLAAGATWLGPDDPEQDWVFAKPDGAPESPTVATREFKRLAAGLDLPVIRLHDGRHTAATLGFDAGLPLKLISDQLGHANTKITQDVYTHVRRARHDEAAETVSTFVFGDAATGTGPDQTGAN